MPSNFQDDHQRTSQPIRRKLWNRQRVLSSEKKFKARTKETERLWIFVGIHTSNALKIGERMSQITAKAA